MAGVITGDVPGELTAPPVPADVEPLLALLAPLAVLEGAVGVTPSVGVPPPPAAGTSGVPPPPPQALSVVASTTLHTLFLNPATATSSCYQSV